MQNPAIGEKLGSRRWTAWVGNRTHLGAAALVVLVLILSECAGLGPSSDSVRTRPTAVTNLPIADTTGASLLATAEESLARGGGPAAGLPMTCSSTGGGATCSTRSISRTDSASPVPASSYPPTPRFPDTVTPSARYGASISLVRNATSPSYYDVVLFGGANSSGYVYGDTWQFNERSLVWVNVTPLLDCSSSTCPIPRHDATATWDSVDARVLLFGGCSVASPGWTQSVPDCGSGSGNILSDTWTYRILAGAYYGTWTRVCTSCSPPARYAEGLADDTGLTYPSGSAVIMFGGCGVTCPLGDTWSYVAGVWTNLGLGTHPSNRFGMAMAYAQGNSTTATNLITLFGGCTSVLSGGGCGGASNDTWLFYGGAWEDAIANTNCSPTVKCPSARYYMGQTSYQGAAGYWSLTLYGGAGPGGIVLGDASTVGGDWWAFQAWATPAVWAQSEGVPGYSCLSTSNTSLYGPPGWCGPAPLGPPVPRYDSMLLGNNIDGGMLFGGSSSSGSSLGDTWWSETGGSGLIWPPPTPSAEYGESMVYDSVDRSDLLFGGCGAQCGNASTWNFSANTWMPWYSLWPALNSTNSPTGRMNASMIFFNDSGTRQDVVLFGGVNSNGTLLNDTWVFLGGVWSPAPLLPRTAQPSPRQSAAFAYNYSAEVGILFGGCGTACPLRDTWELSWVTAKSAFEWIPESPMARPPARYGGSMTYDSLNGAVLLFGGCGAGSPCSLSDTWTYITSGNWVQCTGCTGANSPSARWGAAMTYDSVDSYVLLFGGCGTSACPMRDTWKYASGTWSNLSLAASNSPPASYDSAVANDTRGGDIFLVGGVGINGETLGGIGWEYQGAAIGGTWTTMSLTNQLPRSPTPTARVGVSLAFNSTGQYVLLFGGCQDTTIAPCGPIASQADTWEFVNGTWRWICSDCGPSARWDASLVFDVTDNYFVLVGGCKASSVKCSSSTVLDDVWKFGHSTWTSLASPPFVGRGDASMAWDGLDHFVLLFGGLGCSLVCGDSWRYVGGTWTSVTVPTGLTARFGAAMAYDANPSDRYIVLVEGQSAGGTVLTDTWKYTLAGGWVQLSITGPTGCYDASMTYDAVDGYLVLFGGLSSSGLPLAYGYEYHGGIWGGLALHSNVGPRWGEGLVYDPAAGPAGFTLLFGGSVGGGVASTLTQSFAGPTSPGQGDTWELLGDATPPGEPTWLQMGFYS
jgi:galactose oxidase-like protein